MRKTNNLKSKTSIITKCILKKSMLFVLILSISLTVFASDNIVINQVLYDPMDTESGGEAVELYNPTNSSIDISGYILRTETSEADATISGGTIIQAYSYYLIADSGWSGSRDNLSWPEADHEEAITMTNTDSGIAIVDLTDAIIDAVGWGDSAGIESGLYEGTPAESISPGYSLKRVLEDTDNNSLDFAASLPEFHNSQYQADENESEQEENATMLTLQLNITSSAPVINEISISPDDNPDQEYTQILPLPGQVKELTLSIEITDDDGIETLQNINAIVRHPDGFSQDVILINTQNLSSITGIYEGIFEQWFYFENGDYSVEITASDYTASTIANQVFEVLELTAVSLDTAYITFSDSKLGDFSTVEGDELFGTDKLTLMNTGNTVIDLGIYGSDLQDGDKHIAVNNIMFSFDNDFSSSQSGILSNELQIRETALQPEEYSYVPISFRLYVPTTTLPGSYASAINLIGMCN